MSELVTIVGGGLAGCSLAWALRERGREVRVFDRDEAVTSSKIAAGIVNPVTGPKLTLTWRFAELWPVAQLFYSGIAEQCGSKFFHRMPLVRLFNDTQQVVRWQNRLRDPVYPKHVVPRVLPAIEGLKDEFGGFETPCAGYLDVPAFIAETRAQLGKAWVRGEGSDAGGLTIFCEGSAARSNPLFNEVHFKPAKGEILDLRIEGLDPTRIMNRGGVWLLPLGDNQFRAGSTYDWESADKQPTGSGRAQIEERLRRLLALPYEVISHRAAVRPVIRASKVLLGMHSQHDQVGFFNGLGSKGVLSAPFFARQFAAALCGEGEIDSEVDLRHYL